MKVCPKCQKPVEAKDELTMSRKYTTTSITCSCGYEGLPIEVEERVSKKD